MSHLQALRDVGHVVLESAMPSRRWFEELYEATDVLIDELSDAMRSDWQRAALAWLAEGDNDSYFCGVPAAFKDRSGVAGKRNKVYLQWFLEFSRSEFFKNTMVAKLPSARLVSLGIAELHHRCSEHLAPLMSEMMRAYPEFTQRYTSDRPLPISLKLVRYNRSPGKFATDPHFDKSAVSMILQADDPKVHWRIGQGNPCRISQMTAPFEYPDNADAPSPVILFPGLSLQAAGVDIPPSPHFVLPVEDRPYRHSIIAFLIVPHLSNADSLDTTAPTIHDALDGVD